jgi:hypothetical protein
MIAFVIVHYKAKYINTLTFSLARLLMSVVLGTIFIAYSCIVSMQVT